MIRWDFHVHTTFSDGKNTPEEMVLAAIQKGMTAIGFSDHSHTPFDTSYCMGKDQIPRYQETIWALREKYRGKIQIFCGIEQDLYSGVPAGGFDYVIGSVHYLQVGQTYIPVDESPKILLEAAKTYFGGDIYKLVEAYYRAVSEVVGKTGADIIGHFDLIRKFNRGGCLFSEEDPRYLAPATAAADQLLKTGKCFEINTGAVSRGYRQEPYPSPTLRSYISTRGGKWIASSDSHRAQTLCFGFDCLSENTMALPEFLSGI